MIDKESINEILKRTPLGGSELSVLLGWRTRILKYNEVTKYSTIEQLLSPYGNVIILFECSQDFGHLTCLKNIGNAISFSILMGTSDSQKVC